MVKEMLKLEVIEANADMNKKWKRKSAFWAQRQPFSTTWRPEYQPASWLQFYSLENLSLFY